MASNVVKGAVERGWREGKERVRVGGVRVERGWLGLGLEWRRVRFGVERD